MSRVRVNIEEVMDCFNEMREDGYSLAELEIIEEEHEELNELAVSAIETESDTTLHYTNVQNIGDNL